MTIRVGVLTSSDACAAGLREDLSGPAIIEALPPETYEVVERLVLPDEKAELAHVLREWSGRCDLILTTGGTGFSSRDVMPEATLQVVDRLVPGIPEALRAEGLRKTPFAILSRGTAGIAGRALIVNLPGSPRAVREGMAVLLPVLPHAVDLLQDRTAHEGASPGKG